MENESNDLREKINELLEVLKGLTVGVSDFTMGNDKAIGHLADAHHKAVMTIKKYDSDWALPIEVRKRNQEPT